jgi:hypothetical protein
MMMSPFPRRPLNATCTAFSSIDEVLPPFVMICSPMMILPISGSGSEQRVTGAVAVPVHAG